MSELTPRYALALLPRARPALVKMRRYDELAPVVNHLASIFGRRAGIQALKKPELSP
jgi:hypothetical protein